MKQVKEMIRDLLTGILIWSLLVLIVLEIISQKRWSMAAGVLWGTLAAAALIWHMYHHLDIALDLDSRHAQRHIQFAAMQRFAGMGVVIAVSMIFYRYIHPLGTVPAIFGVKISALLQPKIHKLWERYLKKNENQNM